ncbi:helix-turn-helix domain-containing protein [Pseudonocardia kunmingensis]|uniref:DNA-binding PucR family transcriptional regulator n=1 Tax=Pseudonocardia kunmingensis TaxID=630975 RepID=A0A543DRH4_9PSEU|nr:GAF domain-containing protein [Pseudonocardia kunmingensis]TQM11904.1 DNA-binding PucR family transcriptional regulator [Pseudonocardia kunmingensis]
MTRGAGGTADETIARLLRLLATEAPGEAFDRLAAQVEAGAPGPGRDELLVAIGRAARIRGLLAHRKRREKETHALIETARDLASLRDIDAVLDAIVHRARQLLGTDATYLALRDTERGDVYMRITLGTVTRAIESVRQPLGSGVGGRIIATGEPFATSDYLRDPRLQRDAAVTDAVVEDGIVSMAGVPLRVGEDVIGALFVANRYERSFDPSEIELLSSLADHAAIVIENARLFEAADTSAQRLRDANAELSRQGRALERAGAAHEQLMPMALRGADLTELVERVAAMLDGTVIAADVDGEVLAAAGPAVPPDPLPAPRPDAVGAAPDPAADGTWTVPVQAGDDAFGHLVLVTPGPLPDADVRTFERAAQTAALLLLMERQVSAAEQNVRGELIDDLLAEREPDWTAFTRRARRSGALDFRVPHTVVVLTAPEVPRRHLLGRAAAHAARSGGPATEHAGRVVVLLPRAGPDAAHAMVRELGRAIGGAVTAGVAGPAPSAPEIRACHREAERCLQLLLALGREGQSATLPDLGVLGLVLDGSSPPQVRALLAESVTPLRRYDEQHNTLLLETLDAYFTAGQNPRAAARALQVHPNTVYQRLDRIDRVLGHRRWREPEGALDVRLALQLRRVLEHIPLQQLTTRDG